MKDTTPKQKLGYVLTVTPIVVVFCMAIYMLWTEAQTLQLRATLEAIGVIGGFTIVIAIYAAFVRWLLKGTRIME